MKGKHLKKYEVVLSIAGSDSSAGAGIQADIKTISALGGYAVSVITVVTAQNTRGVWDIYPLPPALVEKQMDVLFNDITIDGVKIGMLYSSDIVEIVAEKLKSSYVQNIVIDPILVSSSGKPLLRKEGFTIMKEKLFPLARLITPNIPEASEILNLEIKNRSQMHEAAEKLAQEFNTNILLKGGHLPGNQCWDILMNIENGRIYEFTSKRIRTKNTHGTGCTLSSAITTFLVKGYSMVNAIEKAKYFVTKALELGSEYSIGKGFGPLHHFFKMW